MLNKFKVQVGVERTVFAAVTAAALALGGCATVATVTTVDPPSALNGHELDTALSLYGPYAEHTTVRGRDIYLWRRSVLIGGQPYACELRAEIAYRQTIRATKVEGNQGACQAFWVRYSSEPELARRDGAAAADKPKVAANHCANCRPVGTVPATETAAVDPREGR
jgi:hypothetical protein